MNLASYCQKAIMPYLIISSLNWSRREIGFPSLLLKNLLQQLVRVGKLQEDIELIEKRLVALDNQNQANCQSYKGE